MSTKYYVDQAGNYLGGFGGHQPPDRIIIVDGEEVREPQPFVRAQPPSGAIEVSHAPAHAADLWTGNGYIASAPTVVEEPINAEELLAALEKKGLVTREEVLAEKDGPGAIPA